MKNRLLSKILPFSQNGKAESQLLEQRYVDLHTTYEKIRLEKERIKQFAPLVEKIDKLFELPKSWDNANHIEQFLVPIYTPPELDLEIKVKLLHAKRRLREDSWRFYDSEFGELDEEQKQSLLSRLYKDLHWAYDVEELGKDYTTKTRIRTSILFIVSIFMFFMIDQVTFIADLLSITSGDRGDFIVTAMAAGWMGTSFSMLISLKNRIEISSISDLKVIHRFDYLLSRALIGMVSGLLLFYAFESGILTGVFFPDLSTENTNLFSGERNAALLIVWCFVSGFSEKLVPDLLNKTEQNITQNNIK